MMSNFEDVQRFVQQELSKHGLALEAWNEQELQKPVQYVHVRIHGQGERLVLRRALLEDYPHQETKAQVRDRIRLYVDKVSY